LRTVCYVIETIQTPKKLGKRKKGVILREKKIALIFLSLHCC
jgi:hypothetical protein